MSGVEIAGFVLAALPLMISALEHYSETASVLEGWWKVKRQYMQCVRELKYHKLAFEENLELLLLPLIADDENVSILLAHPGGETWNDPALEELLKARMPKSYASYLDTMEIIEETLEGLEEVLGMKKVHFRSHIATECELVAGETGKRAFLTRMISSFEFQSQSIQWAFKKDTRDELFANFKKHNDRLRDILGTSDKLASLRNVRASKSIGTNDKMWEFWSHGNNVYRLLMEAWSCHCQAFHQARLLLQHRMTPTADFRITFWFKQHIRDLAPAQSPWISKGTSIKFVEQSQTSMPVVKIQALNTLPMPLAISQANAGLQQAITKSSFKSRSTSRMRPGKDVVSFKERPLPAKKLANAALGAVILPPSTSISPGKRHDVSFAPVSLPTSQTPSPIITNLCTAFSNSTNDLPYGCLRGEECQYLVQPLVASSYSEDYITLDMILSTTSPVTLSRRQRYEVALILASTQIQLHPTPWLKSTWNKNDILFPRDPQNPEKICTDQPYISRSFSKSPDNGTSTAAAISDPNKFHSSVRNLGIILLELCFGRPIEEHRICRSLPAADEEITQMFHYMAATKWAQDVVAEAGPGYSDAVSWCLNYTSEINAVDGKEDKWRETMFVKVVEPLKYCHDQLMAV